MKGRESFAYNYLIFRDPVDYFLVLFPTVIGLLAHFIQYRGEQDVIVDETIILLKQYEAIDEYLVVCKYVIIVLLAFFCCYRWSVMQYDGSYGFWLTLGIKKSKFFINTLLRFILVFTFASLLGLFTMIHISGIYLKFSMIVKIVLLIASSTSILIGIAVFLGNIIKNPEIASIIFLLLTLMNQFSNNDYSTFQHRIFQAEFQYRTLNPWNSFFLSTLVAILLNMSSYRIHLALDMEL